MEDVSELLTFSERVGRWSPFQKPSSGSKHFLSVSFTSHSERSEELQGDKEQKISSVIYPSTQLTKCLKRLYPESCMDWEKMGPWAQTGERPPTVDWKRHKMITNKIRDFGHSACVFGHLLSLCVCLWSFIVSVAILCLFLVAFLTTCGHFVSFNWALQLSNKKYWLWRRDLLTSLTSGPVPYLSIFCITHIICWCTKCLHL